MPSSLTWPASASAKFMVDRISSPENGNGRLRLRQTKGQVKIVHHGLRAANQPLDSVRRVVLEQARAKNGHFDQLDRLVETGADQAPLRCARGVPGKEPLCCLLQPLLVVGGEPPLQIGQELPNVECGISRSADVEVDQSEPARGDQQVFAFEVAVREGGWLLR